MKIQQFLDHHGVRCNPFAEEDAQTDRVFKEHCIETTFHPNWDKVFGDPSEPATSLVFGEKGSGKTAMRLQIARHVAEHNRRRPDARLLVIHYDDFNPFLDRFRDRVGRRRRPEKALAQWKLWDHMDAILSLGVTGLVDRILGASRPSPAVDAQIDPADVDRLSRHQARDLLLLAAFYDQSISETFRDRWRRLRRRLRFSSLKAFWDLALGAVWTFAAVVLIVVMFATGHGDWLKPLWFYLALAVVGWFPFLARLVRRWLLARSVVRKMRVGNLSTNPLRQALMHFTAAELASQPLPNKDRTDDRYELLSKFQALVAALGYKGVLVLVDRLDEPHLINGAAEAMKALLWPMLDNKFLKHPGMGIKLMAPVELRDFIERESSEFHQRARLDKQNMVRAFQWTPQSLLDVANARIAACADGAAKAPSLRDFFDPAISDQRLQDSLRMLRAPRHLFKFIYRLLVAHCNSHTDQAPAWKISSQTFESELALFQRDLESYDRGAALG